MGPGGKASLGKIDFLKPDAFLLEAKMGSNAGDTKVGTAKRGTASWNVAMEGGKGQAMGYASSLPKAVPFLIVADIGYCFDLYADFELSRVYQAFPVPGRQRIYLGDLATGGAAFPARTSRTRRGGGRCGGARGRTLPSAATFSHPRDAARTGAAGATCASAVARGARAPRRSEAAASTRASCARGSAHGRACAAPTARRAALGGRTNRRSAFLVTGAAGDERDQRQEAGEQEERAARAGTSRIPRAPSDDERGYRIPSLQGRGACPRLLQGKLRSADLAPGGSLGGSASPR